MQIAIASGKGGTGKTLIATSLATLWANQGRRVAYVDTDVEEPNGHLFLNPKIENSLAFGVKVPTLNDRRCSGHGKCQEACAFNAILSAKDQVIVFHELCHGCGACLLACPDGSLHEEDRAIGTISTGRAADMMFISGRLDVGEVRAAPLIEGVLKQIDTFTGMAVVDAPPGTSCSAMAASHRADVLLLVTEPTPFGLHDLELAVGMGRALGKTLAAVINRADLGDSKTENYLKREGIPILAEIPFDRAVAESYASARLPINDCGSFKSKMIDLDKALLAMIGGER